MNNAKPRDGTGGSNSPRRDLKALALFYASKSLPVVPLHGFMNGRCTCGNDKCIQPGRHPRTAKGIASATTDRVMVEMLWGKWPNAKIGIVLGGPSKLLALMTDGDVGQQKLSEIITFRGDSLPSTVKIRDHDRRIRLFFEFEGNHIQSRDIAAGVRLLGDGDFIVAPSGLDDSTAKRRFEKGRALGKVKIARAPDWLLKINAERGSDNPSSSSQLQNPGIVLVPTSEIEPEKINWVWPGVIASGRITGLVGYPGLGKSQVAIDVAATVSTGRDWPGDAANGTAADVIILSAEDDAADTVVPRLIAAGANRTRVHVVKAVTGDDGIERAFSLAVDLERLEKEHDLQRVRLLVVDPISAYLGTTKGKSVSRHHDADVRTVLGRFAKFAARHDLGVLAISHLNKTSGARAITRIMGSLEWVAAPRAVFLVVEEAVTRRRLFLPLKNNLAPDRIGYAFAIKNIVVADGIRSSAVVWSDDPVTISGDEALAATAKKETSEAMDFLQQVLNDGPTDQTEILRLGKAAGFTEKNLRTAREKLGVTTKKEGFGENGKWVWVLAGGATVLRDPTQSGH